MTDQERAELRQWAAEAMGWTLSEPSDIFGQTYWGKDKAIMKMEDWHPDTDLNQAFMVVERIKSTWKFSDRLKFIKNLEKIIADQFKELQDGKVISGLWNIFYIKPKHIIRAAKATGVK